MNHKAAGHSPNIKRNTPRLIFEGLNTKFDLDPCTPKEYCPAHDYCKRGYSLPEQDGLKLPWEGLVWLNPPFARGMIKPWIEKAKKHNNTICLVTSYFTSSWFHENPPDGVFLLAFRPKYEVPKNDISTVEGLYASILMSYGIEATEILANATLEGTCYIDPSTCDHVLTK